MRHSTVEMGLVQDSRWRADAEDELTGLIAASTRKEGHNWISGIRDHRILLRISKHYQDTDTSRKLKVLINAKYGKMVEGIKSPRIHTIALVVAEFKTNLAGFRSCWKWLEMTHPYCEQLATYLGCSGAFYCQMQNFSSSLMTDCTRKKKRKNSICNWSLMHGYYPFKIYIFWGTTVSKQFSYYGHCDL